MTPIKLFDTTLRDGSQAEGIQCKSLKPHDFDSSRTQGQGTFWQIRRYLIRVSASGQPA